MLFNKFKLLHISTNSFNMHSLIFDQMTRFTKTFALQSTKTKTILLFKEKRLCWSMSCRIITLLGPDDWPMAENPFSFDLKYDCVWFSKVTQILTWRCFSCDLHKSGLSFLSRLKWMTSIPRQWIGWYWKRWANLRKSQFSDHTKCYFQPLWFLFSSLRNHSKFGAPINFWFASIGLHLCILSPLLLYFSSY